MNFSASCRLKRNFKAFSKKLMLINLRLRWAIRITNLKSNYLEMSGFNPLHLIFKDLLWQHQSQWWIWAPKKISNSVRLKLKDLQTPMLKTSSVKILNLANSASRILIINLRIQHKNQISKMIWMTSLITPPQSAAVIRVITLMRR